MGINYITQVKTPEGLKEEYSLRKDLAELKAARDKEIADIIKRRSSETMFFVDAVQAAGKIPINVKDRQIQ